MPVITPCSSLSSQTFIVLERGPGTESVLPNLQLSQNLEPGMVLSAVASTTDISRFDIKDIKNNILFRIEPRINQKLVAFNSAIGDWAVEERASKNLIKNDVKYILHVAHELTGYRLFVNGEEIHFFKHRSKLPGVAFDMHSGGKCFLLSHKLNEPKWAVHQPNNGMYITEYNDIGIPSPHEIQFQGSYPISSIVITGIINSNTNYAKFSLLNSSDEEIFHFSIRLIENCVVRNSRLEGVWGKEETNGGMPFRRNERFTLAIDVDVDYYKTYVDGVEFITYKHRTSYYNVIKLKISEGMNIFKTIYQK